MEMNSLEFCLFPLEILKVISEFITDGKTWKSYTQMCKLTYVFNTQDKIDIYSNHIGTIMLKNPKWGYWNYKTLPLHKKFPFDYLDKFPKDIGWDTHNLSLCPNISLEFLETHPPSQEYQWDMYGLSTNKHLPWELVEKYPPTTKSHNWLWNMAGLSSNESLTPEFVRKHHSWKWINSMLLSNPRVCVELFTFEKTNIRIAFAKSPTLTMDILEKMMGYISPECIKWNMCDLSKHKNLTGEFVLKHRDLDWDIDSVASNQNISIEFLMKHKIEFECIGIDIEHRNVTKGFFPEEISSGNSEFLRNPSTEGSELFMKGIFSRSDLTEKIVLNSNYKWLTFMLLYNKNIPLKILEAIYESNECLHHFLSYNKFAENKNMTKEFIVKHSNWYWDAWSMCNQHFFDLEVYKFVKLRKSPDMKGLQRSLYYVRKSRTESLGETKSLEESHIVNKIQQYISYAPMNEVDIIYCSTIKMLPLKLIENEEEMHIEDLLENPNITWSFIETHKDKILCDTKSYFETERDD